MFSVQLSHEAFVHNLKKAIKEEKSNDLDQIDANNLELYNVTVAQDDLDSGLNNIDLDSLTKLRAVLGLSRVFPDPPPDGHLHLIVIRPPGGCTDCLRL
jgi:Crinkler effector protein N-terminal domain